MRLSQTARAGLVVIIATALLCAPAQAQTKAPATPARVPAKKFPVAGVKNFGEVTPYLYRGAQPTRDGLKALAGMGVDIVVDLRLSGQSSESKLVTADGMKYVSIPWHCLFPSDEKVARFLAVVRNNPKKKIFVHCRFGDDRTGLMIAAYRMAVENWTPDEAWKEMRQFGVNSGPCFRLRPYEATFPERLKNNPALRGDGTSKP